MRVEFRIPISPNRKFYSLVRFYNFALRRLPGAHYRNARLRVVVGDHCDLDEVRRENVWSEEFDIVWERTPDASFDEFYWAGTANRRVEIAPGDADVIILSDADTVLLRDIDPLLEGLPSAQPTVCGHMAHNWPRLGPGAITPASSSPDFWPLLFDAFGLAWPSSTYRYSIPRSRSPECPAYFNLGFIALNASALARLAEEIAETTRRVNAMTDNSFMCCQIALTIVAYRNGFDIEVLSAAYNAANDLKHLRANALDVEQIRVLHFLREDEIDRGELQPERIDGMLGRPLANPANVALQALARKFRDDLGH
jgi:hypothetical protein